MDNQPQQPLTDDPQQIADFFADEKQSAKFGIKINKCVLEEKQWTIENVAQCLGLEGKEYVIGLDVYMSRDKVPHYHIHWVDTRSYEALRSVKKRAMEGWGYTTKIYQAKKMPDGNKYCWFAYAIKENELYVSPLISDRVQLDKHIHTQRIVKQSQLNYLANQDDKKAKAATLEEKCFAAVKEYLNKNDIEPCLQSVAVQMHRTYRLETGNPMTKNQLLHYSYKYLLDNKIWSDDDYVQMLLIHHY